MERQQAPAKAADSALFGLIQRLADNKYWIGRRYAEWCTSAPTLESAVAASAMAQDEIGHARSYYPLFRRFTGEEVEPEGRKAFHSMSSLDAPFEGWTDFVAVNFLVDTAVTVVHEAAFDSSYVDLRNRARRIAGEEQIHWLHGRGWVKRLAGESPGTKQRLEASLGKHRREALMWFGRPDGLDGRRLVDAGILARLPDQLRDDFRKRIDPVVEAAGIAWPAEDLPWDRWDEDRRRLRPQ
jgi:phenylacetate-CoA oxygenase PaaI subunit